MAIEQLWEQADQFFVLRPSDKTKPHVVMSGSLRSCGELRGLSQKSCCLVVLHESLHACRWYDLLLETYPCCDSRSLCRLATNRGKRAETYTCILCLTTETLSPIPEVSKSET